MTRIRKGGNLIGRTLCTVAREILTVTFGAFDLLNPVVAAWKVVHSLSVASYDEIRGWVQVQHYSISPRFTGEWGDSSGIPLKQPRVHTAYAPKARA